MKVRSQYAAIANNPLRYLYKHVLPIETTCEKCQATLTVDSIKDFQYHIGSPPGANEPHGPYLTIWCSVCNTTIKFEAFDIYPPIVRNLFIRAIKNFYYSESQSELMYKNPFLFGLAISIFPLIFIASIFLAAIFEG